MGWQEGLNEICMSEIYENTGAVGGLYQASGNKDKKKDEHRETFERKNIAWVRFSGQAALGLDHFTGFQSLEYWPRGCRSHWSGVRRGLEL